MVEDARDSTSPEFLATCSLTSELGDELPGFVDDDESTDDFSGDSDDDLD